MRHVRNILLVALVGPLLATPSTPPVRAESPSSPVNIALSYSSYLGTDDCGLLARAIAVDPDGSTYIAGSVTGACFPMTQGALQVTARDTTTNGFVAKLNPDGATLAWATYVGGNSSSECSGIGFDEERNVYVIASTYATDLPVRGGFQGRASESSFGEGYLLKLDPSGSNLLFGSYLGGRSTDVISAMAVGPDGIVTVAGGTTSADFPTTANAFLRDFPGSSDIGFVSVIDTTRTGVSSLLYSTYFGGSRPGANLYANAVVDIALDATGVVYLCGATNAADFPITPGAIRTTPPPPGGTRTGFLAMLDPTRSGSAGLRYGTYIGGSVQDWCRAVAIDGAGAVHVAGVAFSADFPVTDGAFQTNRRGETDAFALKLDLSIPDDASLEYSTFIGGNRTDQATSLDVDAQGRAVIGGYTSSGDFPIRGSVMPLFNRSDQPFAATVVRLESGGAGVEYSTLFGGGTQDIVEALVVDASGRVHTAVSSFDGRLPTTPGAMQAVAPGPPSGLVSALIRFAEVSSVVGIEPPAAISVTASAVRHDRIGAFVEFPPPTLTGDEAGRATAIFDPPSGSFFPLGVTQVLAYAYVDGCITAVTVFPVTVTVAFDTCVSSTPGVRFRIVADSQSPIYGAWQFVDDGDEDVSYLGVADSVREIPGKAILFSDPSMKARYRLSTGTWKIKVRVHRPGSEFPYTYTVIAPPGTCTN